MNDLSDSKKNKQCNIHLVGGSCFHDKEIIDACIDWCQLVGLDSNNEDVMSAFCMGAKLSLSNKGWCNCH
jgi:hypothetical protein